jgi:tRNA-splicing ligase RtcB
MAPESIKKVGPATWELPKSFKEGMRVPARIIATEKLLNEMDDGVFDQISNVATLRGIQKYAYCMPDGHWGYGFPIGGVAAFDMDEGIISPGGIGFDINCGMRLVTTNLTEDEVKPKIKDLVNELYNNVPVGVGGKSDVSVNEKEFKKVMVEGAKWAIQNGYGWDDDKNSQEGEGAIEGADPEKVSEKAVKRGIKQLGTLGSGNHYLEVQVVKDDNVFDKDIAKKMGIHGNNQIVVMFHCGSRGFGHQVATDYVKKMKNVMGDYGLSVPDKELACAPIDSDEGRDYFAAMTCAANMAFANRQVILHKTRKVFEKIFEKSAKEMEMDLVYDIAHNIAKMEKYDIDGEEKELMVHRKGATRAFGPGHKELSEKHRQTGQPVIIGGSMETGSYLLVGTDEADAKSFASTAHGSGRTKSRSEAKEDVKGDELQKEMEEKGIYVKTSSMSGLAEEAGEAYKSIDEVIGAVEEAGISKKVAAFKPIGNIKG